MVLRRGHLRMHWDENAARDQQKNNSLPAAGARLAWSLNQLQPSAGVHGVTTTFRNMQALPVAHQLAVQSLLSLSLRATQLAQTHGRFLTPRVLVWMNES
jgi:hypothetical protein